MVSLASIKDWQAEADVVIVGYGLSGAITAIEAHDIDGVADVMILEKMPERYAGGNSRASGQDMFVGVDPETLMRHQRALNEPHRWGPSDHCRLEIEVSHRGVGVRAPADAPT